MRVANGPGVTHVTYDEVNVRPLGDVALVHHGVTHSTCETGVPHLTRYAEGHHLTAGAGSPWPRNFTAVG